MATSVWAPTRMTATPPLSLASRSCSFSLSYSEVVTARVALISATRAWMAAGSPQPSTMTVLSLETFT